MEVENLLTLPSYRYDYPKDSIIPGGNDVAVGRVSKVCYLGDKGVNKVCKPKQPAIAIKDIYGWFHPVAILPLFDPLLRRCLLSQV